MSASRLIAGAAVAGLPAAGCGSFTDAATRLAYDIEAASRDLGSDEGARVRLEHRTPSAKGQCDGPYRVQLDKAGLIVVWCMDAAGNTVSSHSTSYHRRFVETERTYILNKPAAADLRIQIERKRGQAVLIGAW